MKVALILLACSCLCLHLAQSARTYSSRSRSPSGSSTRHSSRPSSSSSSSGSRHKTTSRHNSRKRPSSTNTGYGTGSSWPSSGSSGTGSIGFGSGSSIGRGRDKSQVPTIDRSQFPNTHKTQFPNTDRSQFHPDFPDGMKHKKKFKYKDTPVVYVTGRQPYWSSNTVKLPKIVVKRKRWHKLGKRRIHWGPGGWMVTPAQRRLGLYLRYQCRRQVEHCRVTHNQYTGYCQLTLQREACFARGCTEYELQWLQAASCQWSDESRQSQYPQDWVINAPLQMSLSNFTSPECLERLDFVRDKYMPNGRYIDGRPGSYCALLVDYQSDILDNADNDTCSMEEWSRLNTAACGRTVVDFEEEWVATPSFRLLTAVTREQCQLNVDSCKAQYLSKAYTSINTYCSLFKQSNRENCVTVLPEVTGENGQGNNNSSTALTPECTQDEWDSLKKTACPRELRSQQANRTGGATPVSTWSVGLTLLALLSALCLQK